MIAISVKIWRKLLQAWWALTVPYRVRCMGAEVGTGVGFQGMPIVSLSPSSKVLIDDAVVLCSDSRFTALGVSHPVVIRTMREGAVIRIGKRTGISGSTICAAVSVRIGDDCLIGSGVLIADNDFHAIEPLGRRSNKRYADIRAGSVSIGNNVFIGARTIVLKGVSIGDNSVIGAGSIVRSSIPSNTIAVGNPAAPVRSIGASGGLQ